MLFYTLMEYGALVNEMLLMLSGDIESNPGPRKYLLLLAQYLLSYLALPLHFQYMYYNWVERIVVNSK